VSDASALVGDFLVASVELADGKGDSRAWLALASATEYAMRTEAVPKALLDELFATLTEHELVTRVRRVFETLWPRLAWDLACVMRSGFEALRDIFERHAPALVADADMSRSEQRMIQHGDTLFVPLPIPEGTPLHHWWWRAGAPPAERTMQMNERMRDLLPPRGHFAANVPRKFRELVAHGFVAHDGMVFFRDRLPLAVPVPKGKMHASWIEADTNAVRLSDLFEVDPSRRPVDTAASAIACARHLAYELRRAYPPCRIVINVHPSLNAIRFHQIRPGEDWATKDGAQTSLDHYTSAMLVLDSV
jgi:hypothetical protein